MPNTSTPISQAQDHSLIPLSGKKGQGLFAKVSPHRFAYLSQYRWYADRGNYVIRNQQVGKSYRFISMHREVMGFPAGRHVDHIDGDPLNNTDDNLRLATREQNLWNIKKPKSAGFSSRFRGVHYHKKNRTWVASICNKGQSFMIGSFSTEEEAARARDGAVILLRGEFGVLSIPDQPHIPFAGPRIRVKTSRHKGVCFDKSRKKWMTFTYRDGRRFHLGRFGTEEEAIKAWDDYMAKQGGGP